MTMTAVRAYFKINERFKVGTKAANKVKSSQTALEQNETLFIILHFTLF